MTTTLAHAAIWTIVGLSALGVVTRPFKAPEAIWAVAGAVALVACGLLEPQGALSGLLKSLDVCLFLAGMMLLSETARQTGLFDWLATHAVGWSAGSPRRLFLIVFGVGVAVTAVMSNDATAVVLTPAVYAAARRGGVRPLPLLFACAFVANAASFVLPISNPANLVLFAGAPPRIGDWMIRFAAPSLLAIAATYVALRWAMAEALSGACAVDVTIPPLATAGKVAFAGVAAAALVLVCVSAAGWRLGLPTFVLGLVTLGLVGIAGRTRPWPIVRGVTWSVLPLVAGLFVLVEGLARTGLIDDLAAGLVQATSTSLDMAAAVSGGLIAIVSNLANNLPTGLVASTVAVHAHPPAKVLDALLIGVDLGPNLSITGSLATLLWLAAIRREGEDVGFWRFLKVGAVVMPPALVLAVGVRLLLP